MQTNLSWIDNFTHSVLKKGIGNVFLTRCLLEFMQLTVSFKEAKISWLTVTIKIATISRPTIIVFTINY